MRTLKELYDLLIQVIQKEEVTYGICISIRNARNRDIFTHEECERLYTHFNSVPRPSKCGVLLSFSYLTPESDYYWKIGKKKPRIRFLKKIIKTL